MKGIIEGLVAIIMAIVLFQALFPEMLQAIVTTTLSAVFLGIIIVAFGVVVWLFVRIKA